MSSRNKRFRARLPRVIGGEREQEDVHLKEVLDRLKQADRLIEVMDDYRNIVKEDSRVGSRLDQLVEMVRQEIEDARQTAEGIRTAGSAKGSDT